MLARLYAIAGSLMLAGYALSCYEGWEFSNARVLVPAPPPGALLRSSSSGRAYYSHSTSGSRSGWVTWGGK